MSSAKHTPGPWIIPDDVYDEDEEVEIISTRAGRKWSRNGRRGEWFVAKVGDGVFWDDKQSRRVKADAHLIAAAPDLLEACEAAEACFVSLFGEDANHRAPALDSLRAAIKKARGEP